MKPKCIVPPRAYKESFLQFFHSNDKQILIFWPILGILKCRPLRFPRNNSIRVQIHALMCDLSEIWLNSLEEKKQKNKLTLCFKRQQACFTPHFRICLFPPSLVNFTGNSWLLTYLVNMQCTYESQNRIKVANASQIIFKGSKPRKLWVDEG